MENKLLHCEDDALTEAQILALAACGAGSYLSGSRWRRLLPRGSGRRGVVEGVSDYVRVSSGVSIGVRAGPFRREVFKGGALSRHYGGGDVRGTDGFDGVRRVVGRWWC